MPNDVEGVASAIEQISKDVFDSFAALSEEQLNWKPARESWSVGQCLDHLVKSNEEFFPELDAIAGGTRKNSFWQNWSPLSGIAGAFLVSTLKKDGQKVKTNQKMTPPSDISADIVERFEKHQQEFTRRIRAAQNADWRKVVLTSPFVKIMTYRMDVGLQALIEHEKRHVRQAKRVVAMEEFPKTSEQTATASV